MADSTDQIAVNGHTNGHVTPKRVGVMAEYATVPTPATEQQRSESLSEIPEDFLLPNGYPDVRYAVLCDI